MERPGASLGTAVFVGTARNCARYLPMALERWAMLESAFARSDFIIAENDSTDGTKAILQSWVASGPRRQVLCLDGIGDAGESRSVVLAAARNRLLDEIRSRPTLRSAEFLIVMDMDDASLAITPERLRRCMAVENWEGLFANQLFYYDDVWALRDDVRSVDDWVERVEAAPPGWRRRWARLRHLTWRNRPIWPLISKPIPVRSAFGGFGIYRMEVALQSRYCGRRNDRDICEHVPFNEWLTDQGARLLLHPGLINMLPKPLYGIGKTLGLV